MKHLLLTTIAAVMLVGCGEPSMSIHEAAEAGKIESVKQHLANGTDINAKDDGGTGSTPLHYVARQGHKEIAELLIAKGADVNAKNSRNGSTPLHYAIDRRYNINKKLIELLIANGADVNAKRGDGNTPLHSAAERGHKEIAELLLAEGADVNAKVMTYYFNIGGWTPLDWVIYNGEIEFAELLRKHGGKSGALDSIHIAAFLGNIEAVKQNLATVVDVNATNVGGDTPLNSAAGNGHKEIVELLISKGADVNAKNAVNKPLHMAAERGHKEIVELLIAEGADVNAKENFGPTALDWAIRRTHTETATLLRKHGAKTGEELKAAGN